jgi:hypothetical protein
MRRAAIWSSGSSTGPRSSRASASVVEVVAGPPAPVAAEAEATFFVTAFFFLFLFLARFSGESSGGYHLPSDASHHPGP